MGYPKLMTKEEVNAALERLRAILEEKGCFGCVHHANPHRTCPHAKERGPCEHREPEPGVE